MVPGDLKCVGPPLAATACLLFCLPPSDKGPQSPRNIVLSHLIASVAALAVVLSGIPQAPAVAAALAIGAMKLTDTVHPPAAPYAFVFASSKWGVQQIFAPGLGAVMLVAIHKVWILTTAAIGAAKAGAWRALLAPRGQRRFRRRAVLRLRQVMGTPIPGVSLT